MARLKGQETSITIISATNGVEPSFNDVKSMELQFDREILDEEYLGQLTNKKDDIFKGVSGNVEFHEETSDIMPLIQRMNEVSKRRLPGESIQIVTTLRFPTGATYRIALTNCVFGNIPISIGSRKDFVSFKFEFAAEDGTFLPTP